ncbi:hypothetical protein J6590_087601 [Homalodisca vitripennis]|nr:hypothetical protein J6590_087601 [Homalodisca vitripennis]
MSIPHKPSSSGDHVIRSAEVHMTTSEFSSLDSHSWEDWFKLSKNCSCHPPNRPEVVIGSSAAFEIGF